MWRLGDKTPKDKCRHVSQHLCLCERDLHSSGQGQAWILFVGDELICFADKSSSIGHSISLWSR
jgi:hypothetical protein